MSRELDAKDFADMVMVVVTETARMHPNGDVEIEFTPEVMDEALRRLGYCWFCGKRGCACPNKRLTADEKEICDAINARRVGLRYRCSKVKG